VDCDSSWEKCEDEVTEMILPDMVAVVGSVVWVCEGVVATGLGVYLRSCEVHVKYAGRGVRYGQLAARMARWVREVVPGRSPIGQRAFLKLARCTELHCRVSEATHATFSSTRRIKTDGGKLLTLGV
jgi:hypothetical protein